MMRRRKKLGLAFSDELLKVKSPKGSFRKQHDNDQSFDDAFLVGFKGGASEIISPWRLVVISGIFLASFFILFLRLFHLQVTTGEQNRQRADLNRVQLKIIHAPRGVIYDRNGVVLAESNPGFRLDGHLISRDEALRLESKNDPRSSALEIDAIRYYPLAEKTAHILGYVGEISPEELKQTQYENYKPGDKIGRSGIEQIYESTLKGVDGAEVIEIDASGKSLGTLRRREPVPGKNIHLSIDADLQKASYQALEKGIKGVGVCCGAVVAEEPGSGEILALASIPSYNSNAFTDPGKNNEVGEYFSNSNSPLLNRVIAGTYPPGSTFKITTALAGLSSGKIRKETYFEDTGVMHLGIWSFANWYFSEYGKTEGAVDIVKALKRSNDIFFYKVGESVGEKTLGETAKKLGIGKKLGIDLPGEEDGLIPDNEWKQKNIGEAWYPGDTLHMAIGQGFLLATPLQILAQTAYVASDGKLIEPHLATRVTDANGSEVKKFKYEPIVKDIFKKEDLDLVKTGLEQVPKEGGTAWPFFSFTIPTAGKTGTAEFGDPKNRTHAWYTSYAPVDDPKIVVTALVEAGGEGSTVASPIVKDIYTWYFNPDKTNIKSLDAFQASDSAKIYGE